MTLNKTIIKVLLAFVGIVIILGFIYIGSLRRRFMRRIVRNAMLNNNQEKITDTEAFCNNLDMYLPVTGHLHFPFPENRLQSWYLPAAYWGDKPRFDYAFREESTSGKLIPVWPNVPIKPRLEPVEY